jgi:hypothetical protein
MKPIVVKNSRIPKIISYISPAGDVSNIALFPFIFCKGEPNEYTINHELIHHYQYSELWVFGFLIIYAYDWVKARYKYRNDFSGFSTPGQKAYYRIRAEQEAYRNQGNLSYLTQRKKYSWLSDYQV